MATSLSTDFGAVVGASVFAPSNTNVVLGAPTSTVDLPPAFELPKLDAVPLAAGRSDVLPATAEAGTARMELSPTVESPGAAMISSLALTENDESILSLLDGAVMLVLLVTAVVLLLAAVMMVLLVTAMVLLGAPVVPLNTNPEAEPGGRDAVEDTSVSLAAGCGLDLIPGINANIKAILHQEICRHTENSTYQKWECLLHSQIQRRLVLRHPLGVVPVWSCRISCRTAGLFQHQSHHCFLHPV